MADDPKETTAQYLCRLRGELIAGGMPEPVANEIVLRTATAIVNGDCVIGGDR
jgi:hypothetical protein